MSLLDLVCQQVNVCFKMLESAQDDQERLHLLDDMQHYVDLLRTEISVRQEVLREHAQRI